MNVENQHPAMNSNEEIPALIESLLATEQRLEELTGGEVDTVAGCDGRTFMLRRAQEQLRYTETARQAAILNALPAHVALLDPQGIIISVNEAWRSFGHANVLQAAGHGLGLNYLDVCKRARGDFSSEAVQVAAGIRAVLDGKKKSFSIEYPCHSPAEQRWFMLKVTPLADDRRNGAVVMHVNITDRKISEDTLRDREASLTAAQRIAHFGSWELDLTKAKEVQAGVLSWSDEMFRIAGYEPGTVEVSNELFFHLVHPNDRDPIRRAVARAVREHQEYSIVHRLIRPNGEERAVQEIGQILFDTKTGQPLRILGTAHDITNRRRDEEALRESEERFASAFEHAPIGVALVSPNGRWLKVNRALCDLIGYSEAELQTHTVLELTHPEDVEISRENVRRVLAGHSRSFQIEKRYVHKQGHIITALLSQSLIRDGQGQPGYFIAQLQDITERKRNETRFRRLVESNAQGVFFWNTKGEITGGNDAFLNVVGFTREDLEAGRIDWVAITPPEFAHLDRHALDELARTGVCVSYEKTWIRKDGSLVPILLGAAMFEDNPEEGVCFVFDITERKLAEEVLKQRAAELERFHRLSVGRELQMVELKKEINELTKQAGRSSPYDLSFLEKGSP